MKPQLLFLFGATASWLFALSGNACAQGTGFTNANLTIRFDSNVSLATNWPGNFILSGSPAAGSAANCVIATDLNGDGKLDLVSANFGTHTLTLLTNNGSGGFVLASTQGVGNDPAVVIAADVNGDGKPDLISANAYADTLTVLTNDGSGGFALRATLPVAHLPTSVAAGDVNGDGKLGKFY